MENIQERPIQVTGPIKFVGILLHLEVQTWDIKNIWYI